MHFSNSWLLSLVGQGHAADSDAVHPVTACELQSILLESHAYLCISMMHSMVNRWLNVVLYKARPILD